MMDDTFKWIQQNGGLESDKTYPYIGWDDTCYQDPSRYVIKVNGYTLLDTKDEDYIRDFLVETGPLSIALNANTLQFYFGGIAEGDPFLCDPDAINHGVTLVGYGTEGGVKFWIGKNSWGDYWGEDGYFRMVR